MNKQQAIQAKDVLEAWLNDTWNRGATPYIQAKTTGAGIVSYAMQGGKPYRLANHESKNGTITLNLDIQAIHNGGVQFEEVSEQEGHFVLIFGCRFNQRETYVYVPMPAFLAGWDRSESDRTDIAVMVDNGIFVGLMVNPRDTDVELKKVCAQADEQAKQSRRVAGQITGDPGHRFRNIHDVPVVKFHVRDSHELYMALGNIAMACAMTQSRIAFNVYGQTDQDVTEFTANHRSLMVDKSFGSDGSIRFQLDNPEGSCLEIDTQMNEVILLEPGDGQQDPGSQGRVMAFTYGVGNAAVGISDRPQYVSDPNIVEALVSSVAMVGWPGLEGIVPREEMESRVSVAVQGTSPGSRLSIHPTPLPVPAQVLQFTLKDSPLTKKDPDQGTAQVISLAAARHKRDKK